MNRIKRARLCQGLTQLELAERLGVSNVSVSKWENGKALPSPGHLARIAEVLNTKASDLIEERAG